jgi:glycerophosphoryl diester phosphodiesterase
MRIHRHLSIAQGYAAGWPGLLSRWLLGLVIFLGVSLGLAAELSSSAYTASSPRSVLARLYEKSSPLRWPAAHRGDPAFGQGNSLLAIRGAAQAGIPLIEVDVRRNADGTLFLFHDEYLDVEKVAAPQALIGRRVESLRDRDFSQVRYLGATQGGMATYAEALAAIQSYRTALQLDVKGASLAVIDQAVRTARERGQAHQLLIHCHSLSTLSSVRRRYPDIPVLARVYALDDLRQAYRKLPDIIQIDEEWMTPEIIQEIHAAGSKILVKSLYDLDTPAHWQRFFEAGVDILLTDKAVQMAHQLQAQSNDLP